MANESKWDVPIDKTIDGKNYGLWGVYRVNSEELRAFKYMTMPVLKNKYNYSSIRQIKTKDAGIPVIAVYVR